MTVGAPHSRAAAPPGAGDRAGLLAIDKPAGVTSHDVVAVVRKRLGIRRAGHLGTLDPGATGLLLVLTGAATRAAPALQGGDKVYEAVVRFGLVTSTQDVHGEVLERREAAPDADAVRAAAAGLTGLLDQVPPMVSAIKVGGTRLYELARRGVEVERAPRRVTVHAWEWLELGGATARFRVRCSGGTYVRTLAHDLGRALGCGAAVEELRRLRSEPFGLERAIPLAALADREAAWAAGGYTLEQALAHLPHVALDAAQADAVGHGGRPAVAAAPGDAGEAAAIVLTDAGGRVLALAGAVTAGGRLELQPHVVFPWAVREGRAG